MGETALCNMQAAAGLTKVCWLVLTVLGHVWHGQEQVHEALKAAQSGSVPARLMMVANTSAGAKCVAIQVLLQQCVQGFLAGAIGQSCSERYR